MIVACIHPFALTSLCYMLQQSVRVAEFEIRAALIDQEM